MLKDWCSKIGCIIKGVFGDVKVTHNVEENVATTAVNASSVDEEEKTEKDLAPIVKEEKLDPISIKIYKPIYEHAHGRKFGDDQPKWIVVHYTACIGLSAKSMCKVMKSNTGASSHFYIDEHDIYQGVPLKYVAWHVAGGKVNQPKKDKEMSLEQLATYKADDWRYDLAANNHIEWRKEGDDFKGNYYSLGVDLCVKKKKKNDKNKATDLDWYFEDDAVDNAAKTVAYLAKTYNIKLDHIIRHADATGKLCPQPFAWPPEEGDKKWDNFKNKVAEYMKHEINAKFV